MTKAMVYSAESGVSDVRCQVRLTNLILPGGAGGTFTGDCSKLPSWKGASFQVRTLEWIKLPGGKERSFSVGNGEGRKSEEAYRRKVMKLPS